MSMERLTNHFDYCKFTECKSFDSELRKQGKCKFFDQSIEHCYEKRLNDKLREYEDLEEQGMIPRFHLGNELWTIRLGKVLKSKIVMLQQKKDGTWQYRVSREIKTEYHDTANYKESDCGKLFFLTREEAEAALAEMG